MSNSSELVGKVAFADQVPPHTTFGGFLAVIRAEGIDPEYLYHVLRNPQIQKAIRSTASRTVNIANISLRTLGETSIPVPPYQQQLKIAASLNRLLAIVRQSEMTLRATGPLVVQLRRSLLTAAFRGDLTADWRAKTPDLESASVLLRQIHDERQGKLSGVGSRQKYVEPQRLDASSLPPIPLPWRWVRVGELLSRIEAGSSFKCLERPPLSGEIGVAKVSAVTWGEYDDEQSKTCVDPARIDNSLLIREGDFLFSRANTIELVGACVIAKRISRRVMLSDKILRFHLSGVEPEWLLAMLRSPWGRNEIERLSTGNQLSMRNIGQERIRQIRIPLPPLTEQQELARRLRLAAENEAFFRATVKDAEAGLPRLDQSILAKAFRGELVPQDPDDEPASVLLERVRAERAAAGGGKPRRERRKAGA